MTDRSIAAIQAALDAMEPALRAAFMQAVDDIRSAAQLAHLVDALEKGDIHRAMAVLNVDPAFWAPLDDAIVAAYLRGGRDAIAALPVIPDPAGLGKS